MFTWSAGAAAGAVTGILTTPFDVLKTRLMTQGTQRTYNHVGDCAVKIWREEGWQTFFKVLSTRPHRDVLLNLMCICAAYDQQPHQFHAHLLAGLGAAGSVDLHWCAPALLAVSALWCLLLDTAVLLEGNHRISHG